MDILICLIAKILPVVAFILTADDNAVDPVLYKSTFDGTEDLGRYFSSGARAAPQIFFVNDVPLVANASGMFGQVPAEAAFVVRTNMPIAIFSPVLPESLPVARHTWGVFIRGEDLPRLPKFDLTGKTTSVADAVEYNKHVDAFLTTDTLLTSELVQARIKCFDGIDPTKKLDAITDALEETRYKTTLKGAGIAESSVNDFISAANDQLPTPKHMPLDPQLYANPDNLSVAESSERGSRLADTAFARAHEIVTGESLPSVVQGDKLVDFLVPEDVILTDTFISETKVFENAFDMYLTEKYGD